MLFIFQLMDLDLLLALLAFFMSHERVGLTSATQ